MSQINARRLAAAIREAVKIEIKPYVESYSAIVTGLSTTGVQFRRAGEDTGSEEIYAVLRNQHLHVDDEVAVIQVGKHPFVLGRIRRSALSTPTYTLNANAGTGATLVIGGTDQSGNISLVTGSGSVSSGTQFDFTFAQPMANAEYTVILQSSSNASADLQGRFNPTSRTTTKWSLNLRIAPTISSTYNWFYWIRPYEQ
jgi:hypothetical protein